MRWKALGYFALACAVTLTAPSGARAYCIGWDKSLPGYDPNYYSVPREFQRAKYVVRAKVTKETWVGEDGKEKALQPPFQSNGPRPWGFDPYAGAFYRLKIETAFKGKPPTELTIFSENSTARFWLDVGSDQVLFITEEAFEDPIGKRLTMDTCGNSKASPKANALLNKLTKLSQGQGR